MNENLENYNDLIYRLKTGDRSILRNDLEKLAEKFGSLRPLEDVAKLSFENKVLLKVLVELTRENGQANKIGLLAFHSMRQVGPAAIPYIREEWEKDGGAKGLHYLHMCLLDIVGASPGAEEWRRLMPVIAEREIPLWIGMLLGEETNSRGLIAWALGALTKYAPLHAEQVGELLMSVLYDDKLSVQTYAVRGLLWAGEKSLLQEALFRLARVARDESPLELLLSQRENINVNARDNQGKTALMYAQELGNERIAEVLKQAGAVD